MALLIGAPSVLPPPDPPPPPSTPLEIAANGLSSGEYTDLTQNPLLEPLDIQWHTRGVWWDETRQQMHYMGKRAGSQPGGDFYPHYIYRAQTDDYIKIQPPFVNSQFGHIWLTAWDGENLYFNLNGGGDLHVYRSSSNTWDSPSIPNCPGNWQGNFPGIGWHPNLFGPGDGGVLMWQGWRTYAWRSSTNSWSTLTPTNRGVNEFGHTDRPSHVHYAPGIDSLIVFFNHENGQPDTPVRVAAGAGLSSDIFGEGYATIALNAPPVTVGGAGGTTIEGKVIAHPSAPNTLLLLVEHDTAQVYQSTDYGDTWQLNGQHPFGRLGFESQGGEWTCGEIGHGVVAGIGSSGTGGTFRIWKP